MEQTNKIILFQTCNWWYIFGLTGPNNGSDATGSIDEDSLKKDNKTVINLNINKRYITLGPVTDLIGLAFSKRSK